LSGKGFGTTAGGAAVGRGLGPQQEAAAKAELEGLQEQVRMLNTARSAEQAVAEEKEKQLAKVKALDEFDRAGEAFLSNRVLMEREIAQAREVGLQAGKSEAEIQKRISDIRRKFGVEGKSLAAQEYYQGLVAANKTAMARIDAEEQRALTDNDKRMAQDRDNAGVYAKAKVEIHKKFAKERALLEEQTAEQIAELNINLTTDEVAKIEAIKAEEIRRADANAKLGEITYAEAERRKTLATFNAAQQRAAILEKAAETTAEANIAATMDELTKIDLARQESNRRADAAVRAGTMTAIQAEAEKARAAVDAQNSIRQQVLSINPLAQLQKEYQDKLAIVQFYEAEMAKAGVDGAEFVEAKRAELQEQFRLQRNQLVEQEFASQSAANKLMVDSLNSFASTASSSIMGLIEGTMTAKQAMHGLASTVLNEGVNALVQMGLQYIKNAIIGQAADKAMMASKAANAAAYTAAVTAQVAVTTALAAQSAFAATAAIPIVGPFMAPEAAAAAGAAAGALGAPAIAGAPVAGARRYGGATEAGSLYRINESGRPEMFTASNGAQYMTSSSAGRVTSADDVAGGSGPAWQIIINNNAGGTQATASVDQQAKTVTVAVNEVANQIATNSGPVWSALNRATSVKARV